MVWWHHLKEGGSSVTKDTIVVEKDGVCRGHSGVLPTQWLCCCCLCLCCPLLMIVSQGKKMMMCHVQV